MKESKLLYLLLTLSFIEGGAVMGAELISAKMVAPYFGNSLYVWASVLGITLLSLMLGYLFGGKLSVKSERKERDIYLILFLAGIWLCLMPELSTLILSYALNLSVASGVILSLFVFLVPGLILLSMTSPMIISALNKSVETSGSTTGNIYSLSTLGGIIATFITGFYLLPEFGLRISAYIFGALLVLGSSIGFFMNKKYIPVGMGILAMCIILFSSFLPPNEDFRYKIIYESDGILGQLKVIDSETNTYTRGKKKSRSLYINNTIQTIANADSLEYSVWDWAYHFPHCVSNYEKGSKVLLLGLGGGTFYHQFERLGYKIKAVELDDRIKDVAIEYFGVNKNADVVIDDARHYLNVQKEKYDIITMDLFYNETPPYQALTVESFNKTKEALNEDGLIMLNFYGYLNDEKGVAARSLIKTLQFCGFTVNVTATPGQEKYRNLIILASMNESHDFKSTSIVEPGLPALKNVSANFIDLKSINFDDAIVFTDNNPNLEHLYLEAALEWRKNVTEGNSKIYELKLLEW